MDDLNLNPAVADTPATVADAPRDTPVETNFDKSLGDIFDKLTGNDKARDNTGRFKANESAVPAADGADPDQPVAEALAETPSLSERSVQPLALPPNWPKEKADAFTAIPENLRAPVQEVLQGLHAKMSDQGRALSQFRDIEPIVADMKANYAQLFQDGSQTPASAIATLYNIQKSMDVDPMGTLWGIAERYNLIPQLAQRFTQAGQPALQPQAPQPDPAAMLRQVEQRFASMLSPERLEQQISSVMTKTQTQESISRFSQEKPLWSDVESTLPQFIEIARTQQPDAAPLALLEAAYDMAVYANPATRAKVSAVAPQATGLKSDADRAAKAKAANQINVKTTSNGKAKPRTDDEVYGEAWDRSMSAA